LEVEVARPSVRLASVQLIQNCFDVLHCAAHPFTVWVRELLLDQSGTYLMVSERRAVLALGGLIEFDPVVLDAGSLQLF
jgi:hypothetical protein